MKKIRLALLFGGQSAEHDVSIQSAKNVYDALDKTKYEIDLVGVTRKGKLRILPKVESPDSSSLVSKQQHNETAGVSTLFENLPTNTTQIQQENLDVVIPLLHGPYGEDGTIQGLLKFLGIPFVGASVLGSAIGMDKDVTKRLLRDAGIPVVKFVTLQKHEVFLQEKKSNELFSILSQQVGLPFFVKPANLGSSVGIAKVRSGTEFEDAAKDAFLYDTKILIEEAIEGRELECAVLGNEELSASVVGEIISQHDFYDYEAKYVDKNGALLRIPAAITEREQKDIQHMAMKVCQALSCEGMARVDFFLSKEGKLIVNEINTIPGFTNNSMYPKLWEATGIEYSDLIDTLIALAIQRHKRDAAFKSTRH